MFSPELQFAAKYIVTSRDQNAVRNHSIKLIIAYLKWWNSSNNWDQTETLKDKAQSVLFKDPVRTAL